MRISDLKIGVRLGAAFARFDADPGYEIPGVALCAVAE